MAKRERSESPRYDRGDVLLRGALAGLIGSIVMGSVGIVVAAIKGPSFAVPMSVIAASAIGGGAAGELIVVGSVLHMLVGGAFGALFALVLPKRASIPAILGLAVLYGLVIHLVVVYVILRPLALVETTARLDTWWFLSEHLIYGLTVGVVMAAWLSALRSERTIDRA
jgi:hypothetical protein